MDDKTIKIKAQLPPQNQIDKLRISCLFVSLSVERIEQALIVLVLMNMCMMKNTFDYRKLTTNHIEALNTNCLFYCISLVFCWYCNKTNESF